MGPVVYEVNIDVVADKADAYLEWLHNHADEMKEELRGITLTVIGDRGTVPTPAEFAALEGQTAPTAWHGYTIWYHVANEADLNDYLQNRAGGMRERTKQAWGNSFVGSRRIIPIIRSTP
jgi:hypothetical protein